MNHTVAVGDFEGPLGLLLDLIKRGKFEVTEISVGQITSDYLERIKELESDSIKDISDFLQLGARLLYIKSLALLPHTSLDEQGQELSQLNFELAQYRQFQVAARLLAARSHQRSWPRPTQARLAIHELPFPNLALNQLSEAMRLALTSTPDDAEVQVVRAHRTLESVIKTLSQRLEAGFELQTVIKQCADRAEIIVTFLAVLELIRAGLAQITQVGQFEVIYVESSHA